jgi:SAM-dependent methyltransferase
MRPEQYDLMREVEDRLWWYRGMRGILFSLLERYDVLLPGIRILDAGCGTGRLLTAYRERGFSPVGLDSHPLALRYTAQRGHECVTGGSVNELPFAEARFDLVSCIDVIVGAAVDDVSAVRELCRVTRPGGWVLVSVAAYQWLMSAHDRAVHAARRYTARQVHTLFEEAGLRVAKLTYANTMLFPAAAARRLLTRHADPAGWRETEVPPAWLNEPFRAVLALEQRLIGLGSLPFGLTIIALGRR